MRRISWSQTAAIIMLARLPCWWSCLGALLLFLTVLHVGQADTAVNSLIAGKSNKLEGVIRAFNVIRKISIATVFGPEALQSDSEAKTIKLFVASLPRTGTASMEVALEKLGYTVLHAAEIAPYGQLSEDIHTGRKTLDEAFDYLGQHGFDVGGMDVMGQHWRWAVDKPDVKVILPIRSAQAWAKSWLTVMLTVNDCMNVSGVLESDRSIETLVQAYEAHEAEVKRSIPSERLLVFDLQEGWDPLCKFLGRPAPAEPFPKVLEAETMQTALAVLRLFAQFWPLALALPPLSLLLCCCCCTARRQRKKGKAE